MTELLINPVDLLSTMQVVITPALPQEPSHREVARRLVRHGMADVLDWLGEDVGPAPDALTHVLFKEGWLFASTDAYQHLVDTGARFATVLDWTPGPASALGPLRGYDADLVVVDEIREWT